MTDFTVVNNGDGTAELRYGYQKVGTIGFEGRKLDHTSVTLGAPVADMRFARQERLSFWIQGEDHRTSHERDGEPVETGLPGPMVFFTRFNSLRAESVSIGQQPTRSLTEATEEAETWT